MDKGFGFVTPALRLGLIKPGQYWALAQAMTFLPDNNEKQYRSTYKKQQPRKVAVLILVHQK